MGDQDHQARLDSAAPHFARHPGDGDRTARPRRLWCRLEASTEPTPFGCQHHPSTARFQDPSPCWPRPRHPAAYPARRRPTADRGQQAGAGPREIALASSPIPARNRGMRRWANLPHRPPAAARNDHPGRACTLVAATGSLLLTQARLPSGQVRGESRGTVPRAGARRCWMFVRTAV